MTRGLIAVAGLAVVGAACGSSTHSTSSSGSTGSTTPASSAGTSAPASGATGAAAAYTVSAKKVGNAGTVLVNGNGRTLYLLSSEQGGKVTCTDATGCTSVWPPVALPSGVAAPVAGAGINASMLSTVQTGTGTRVTYGGWPLYTFSGDSGAGMANGIGITSFGGTWHAVNTSGNPSTSASTAPASGGGGY